MPAPRGEGPDRRKHARRAGQPGGSKTGGRWEGCGKAGLQGWREEGLSGQGCEPVGELSAHGCQLRGVKVATGGSTDIQPAGLQDGRSRGGCQGRINVLV
jgi:hypothetical protein